MSQLAAQAKETKYKITLYKEGVNPLCVWGAIAKRLHFRTTAVAREMRQEFAQVGSRSPQRTLPDSELLGADFGCRQSSQNQQVSQTDGTKRTDDPDSWPIDNATPS